MADLEIDKDILEEYSKHGSLYKTAKSLGVQVSHVKKVIDNLPTAPKLDTSECRWDGYGNPEKRKFLVGRMPSTETWNNEIPEVAAARKAFEAGTHELGTGRDGPYILLYSFPRIVRKPRPGYFDLKTEA
jgi:hypothetical protein